MKQILALVLISILFSGCVRTTSVSPKLNPVYVKLSEVSDCNTTYSVDRDDNVTLALDDAKCVTSKLETCMKDREKLHISNIALNAQIFLSNNLKAK